jgi:hypothetical protein
LEQPFDEQTFEEELMSAALVDQVQVAPAGRPHLRLVVDNGTLVDSGTLVGNEPGLAATRASTPGGLAIRWVVRALGVVLGGLLAIVLGVLLGLVLRAPVEGPTAVVTVGAGESLWSVATSVAGPGEDPRDVVERIVSLNGLEHDVLQPGQNLVVPAR